MEAALEQASAVAPVVVAALDRAGRVFPGRRSLEGPRRFLAVKERLDAGEAFSLDLVTQIAHCPKSVWDAACKRAAEDASGRAVEQLRALVDQKHAPAVRFCIEQLLAAAQQESEAEEEEIKE